ncbi:hypothetical protein KUTeg_006145 [Tegillarca granosa]|uniref:Uncharacterized protein n=1 Tax=Tegillarca granosa TaxID=220873 RepID=A0ABQ9FFN3_TEGGR|nr:hypothetical protein KUTeg_006145 [Tegillarca granosa]
MFKKKAMRTKLLMSHIQNQEVPALIVMKEIVITVAMMAEDMQIQQCTTTMTLIGISIETEHQNRVMPILVDRWAQLCSFCFVVILGHLTNYTNIFKCYYGNISKWYFIWLL